MRVKIAIIADDLTGSNDTGAQYAKKGLRTVVLTKPESIEHVKEKVDVIVVDTESRADSAENAYSKVKKVAQIIKKIGIKIIYKKIDSTLRGNIGIEFDAIMDACKINIAILVPAFPANGRITVGGYHLLNQMPLSMTEISKDPLTPVKESHVPTLLRTQTKRSIIHIPLSKVMKPASLENEFRRIMDGKGGIVVLDTVTQNDLKTIATTLSKLGLEKLCGGPAGLAEEMPEALGLVTGKPAVLISGSISEITIKQIRRAEKVIGVQAIKLDVQRILKEGKHKNEEITRVLKNVRANIAKGNDSILTSAISKEAVEEDIEFGKKMGLSNVEISKEIATTFGEIARKITEEKISGMVITGGAIAINVLKVLSALGVRVIEEIMPGVPISQIMGGEFDGLKVVTKAGAFGNEEALANCLKQLKRRV